MILHPGILALLASSFLVSIMTVYAAYHGIRIIRYWDPSSSSEMQLSLEHRAPLLSAAVTYGLLMHISSLFLFIHTADTLSPLFSGSMCAVGTLFANPTGFPVLLLKSASAFLAGLWLIINHADSSAPDYPMLRMKHLMLALLTPIVLAESILLGYYFLGLQPDIITSCCGTMFSSTKGGIRELASLPILPTAIALCTVFLLHGIFGVSVIIRGTGVCPAGILSGVFGAVSVISLVSFISPYIYETPAHHCPFCMLQQEYSYIGYPLYVAILTGSTAGIGSALLLPWQSHPSLCNQLPDFQKKLTLLSLGAFGLFMAITLWCILRSNFRISG